MSSRGVPVAVGGVAYPVSGSQIVVVRDGRVLLQLRPWPPGWELPGGHCRAGEDPAACAVREAEEETGYRVTVVGLAGVYTWAGLRHRSDAVYVGEISGGGPRRSLEAVRTRFVAVDALPATTFPWVAQRARDALAVLAGAPPVHRVQPVHLRHVLFFGSRWAASVLDAARRWGTTP